MRNIAKCGSLLDYDLEITRNDMGKGQLSFRSSGCGQSVNSIVLMGDSTIVPSGRERSCYQVAKSPISPWKKASPGSLKIYSKIYSKKDYGDVLDNALERLAQRRDSKAFGSGMGESAPSLRPSLSPPSQRPHKPKLINMYQHHRYGEGGFLVAYNAGPRRYEEHLRGRRSLPTETIDYVSKVSLLIGSGAPSDGFLRVYSGSGAAESDLFVRPGFEASSDQRGDDGGSKNQPRTSLNSAPCVVDLSSLAPSSKGLFVRRSAE